MRLTNGFDISASALTAQRLRMDVVSSNIANAETTRARFVNGQWQPYQRKIVTIEPKKPKPFSTYLDASLGENVSVGQGVKVTRITTDKQPFKLVYQPTHPDADENGFVRMPNVDLTKEMVDLISATRSYEANVTALNAAKGMITKALEIGR